MLSHFCFAVVVDVTEFVLSELLYAVDIVLMRKTIGGLRNKFLDGRRLLRIGV